MTEYTEAEYAYGSHPSQFARMYLPPGELLPVVVVIHGGFWKPRYGIELAVPLARNLASFGVAAVAVEYRRVGTGDNGGGGWPRTMADVARAVDALATSGQYLAGGRLNLDSVVVIGHSAGGQLAAWLAHRPSLRSGTPGSITPGERWVPVRGAVTQAGVLDLIQGGLDGTGNGAIIDLMEGEPGSVPQRYTHSSPLEHVGDGARVTCVHGTDDEDVPFEQSTRYVDAAVLAGDPARLIGIPGVGHMELIDPNHMAWEVCRDAVLGML
ncbi:alpha/beta fold hydrolase [Nakamurella silvestris]|nr:alpha/beta fold hydrolase [Nakamurella silvestris]